MTKGEISLKIRDALIYSGYEKLYDIKLHDDYSIDMFPTLTYQSTYRIDIIETLDPIGHFIVKLKKMDIGDPLTYVNMFRVNENGEVYLR